MVALLDEAQYFSTSALTKAIMLRTGSRQQDVEEMVYHVANREARR